MLLLGLEGFSERSSLMATHGDKLYLRYMGINSSLFM